jgi:hypothetical protein
MNDSDLIPVTNLQPAPDQARENPMIWTGEEEAMGVFLNAGEADDALDLLFAAVDSANGISAELDPAAWAFVPVDMTVNLFRQPAGTWLGMKTRMIIHDNGIGQTQTTLFDQQGSLGAGLQTLFIRPNGS